MSPAGAALRHLLTGPARRDWEHSIPAVEALRYSVTFPPVRRIPR